VQDSLPATPLPTASTTILATTIYEFEEPASTATGPAYFQPVGTGAAGGSGSAGGSAAAFGEGDKDGVLFVENGNSTAGDIYSMTEDSYSTAGDSCVVEASSPADGALVEVPIEYQAVTVDGSSVLPVLDYTMAEYVAHDLFSCAKVRARRVLQSSKSLRKGGRSLEELGCVGVNSDPDEIAATDGSCDPAILLTVEAGQSCDVVGGGVSLVLGDSATEEAAKEKALGSINTAFSNNVFTNSSSYYYVPGLVALEMVQVPPPPAQEEKVIAPVVTPPNIESSEASTPPISTTGAIVLSLGLIAFIALALMAFRHKRKRDSTYDEFDDDVDDLAAKETSSTDESLDEILRDLDNAYGNQVDVHHCNSATCPICNGRQTQFIDTGDNDTVSEMYPDEFEIGADRNRSFEYKAKPGTSSPRFDNPANIRPRLYEVEDTVDL